MVLHMVRCPPHRVPLRGAPADECHHGLEGPGGPEGPVREIAVIEARDGKHADEERTCRQCKRDRAPACPEHAEGSDVDGQERQTPEPVHLIPLPRAPVLETAVEPSPQPHRGAPRRFPIAGRRCREIAAGSADGGGPGGMDLAGRETPAAAGFARKWGPWPAYLGVNYTKSLQYLYNSPSGSLGEIPGTHARRKR